MSGFTTTPNYGLRKPIVGADNDAWGGDINLDLDTLDTQLKAVSNAQANFVPLNGSAPMTGPLTLVSGAQFTLSNPAQLPARTYEYFWYDPTNAVPGGILKDGSLVWNAATITTLTATTATIPHLVGTVLVDTLTATAFTPASMTIGGNTLGVLSPQLYQYQWAWHDGTNVAGGVASDGSLKWGNATIKTLSLGADPTAPAQAVTKSYFDANAVKTSGATMVGPFNLASDPTAPLMAATRQYVDAAAASGGAGGLAGLAAQRDFPYPPLRDPRRDYGAIGNGIIDDSAAINSCVSAALAAGERAIAINDPFNCPSLNVLISQVLLIGTGRLVNANVQMFVIPPWAPAAPTHFRNRTMTLRNHCAKFATKLRNQVPTDAPAVVVVTGESTYAPSTSSTILPIMWARAQFAIKEANPGKKITFYNRAIGGQRWSNLDGLPAFGDPSNPTVSWYTDGLRAWIEYIRDLAPDVVLIGFSGNDGIAYEIRYMISVLTKLAGFANPPDVILCTSNPYAQQYLTGANTVTGWEGQQAAASMERSWAVSKGIGLVDTSRAVTIHAKGFDPDDIPLKRDLNVTSNANARRLIALPFTWPSRCWGFSAMFYVPAGGWATLGNELQFELGITWGGGTSPSITPRASNAGCILRIGRDTTAGQIYYEVDTSLVSMGGSQDSIHVPKTLIPGWIKPTTDSTSFVVSVVGSRLVIQTITGSSTTDDQWTAFVMANVPRYNQPWFPKITCTAGAITNTLYFEKAGDGWAYAASANPDPRAFYMPSMTEREAYGSQDVPETDWSGAGVGHDSALKGIWAIQCAINSCDWGA
jgi:hypothetical protein